MTDSSIYAFFPWLRRGVATQIARTDDDAGASATREAFRFDVTFNVKQHTANVSLQLYGPGDVVGFDARAVIRTWPGADVFEAETNLFPLIELDQADLPWRYTPARATTTDRLRPWLCLIVLAETTEIDGYDDPGAHQPLPAVRLKDKAPLPRLDQSWAWAHAQVVGDAAPTEATVQDRLAHDPHRVLSRLLCPRRLSPRTPYVGLLVPAFQRGVLAGLGQLTAEDKTDALAPAWTGKQATAGLRLPFYHRWRFQTGGEGDFETLVVRLAPRDLPDTTGRRDMDVSAPGANLSPASAGPLALEGALEALGTTPTPWPERAEWATTQLGPVLNAPATALATPGADPVVAPPLYGQWHAAQRSFDPAGSPRWFQDLNADPRLRATAALGTLVVQRQREALLAGAWQQVAQVRAINEELRHAQLAREAALRLHERHLESGGVDAVLTVTAPVHARILDGGATVRKQLADSPIPRGVLDGQWRRAARRRGALGRRQGRVENAPSHDLLDRLNKGALSPAPPPPPGDQVTLDPGSLDFRPDVRPSKPFEPTPGSGADWVPREMAQPVPDPGGNLPKVLIDMVGGILTPPRPDPRAAVDLGKLRQKVLDALDPRDTIGKAAARRLRLGRGVDWNPEDPIEPILAAPDFPQPMYEPLRDLSQDWLLPGLGEVPPDTLGVLSANQVFVEAFMVGLNHEMARVLLFNEYPTDQRGSYFRQFWDVRGHVGPETPAQLEDIRPIHTWNKTGALGANRPVPHAPDYLVLLVRGEVLRRYPSTIVYAAEAVIQDGKHVLGPTEKQPLFHGTLDPDVTFVGFDLTAAQARGDDTHPGWFFVLQEQPTAPRFGLTLDDAVPSPTRAQLSWKHFATDPSSIAYLDLSRPSGDLPALSDAGSARWTSATVRASDVAFVTWRQPFRVAVHASRMVAKASGTP